VVSLFLGQWLARRVVYFGAVPDRWGIVRPGHRGRPLGQRPVEWCISVGSSTSVFMLGGLEFERDGLLEIEDGRAVHGEVAAV